MNIEICDCVKGKNGLFNVKSFTFIRHSCFKRHSRAALNRQQELSHLPMPPQLRLYDYLQRRKERKPAPVIDLKISKVGNVSTFSQHVSKDMLKSRQLES